MKVKAKDVLQKEAQVDMKYLQDVLNKINSLAKTYTNPIFATLKPTMDKLVTEYKQFMTKKQTEQRPA